MVVPKMVAIERIPLYTGGCWDRFYCTKWKCTHTCTKQIMEIPCVKYIQNYVHALLNAG